jgi:hypothetical protein
VVLSVPVLGGREYLADGVNCLCREPGELADALRRIAAPEQAGARARLRDAAIATAHGYRMSEHFRKLAPVARLLAETSP